MESIYDHPDIYDERFGEAAEKAYQEHYRLMFAGKDITDILDCSYGTGALTLELAQLGYRVTGSDLSEKMLEKGRQNARERGLEIDLTTRCDYRELSRHFDRQFSCVMSTGNALGYVTNEDVVKTLHEMDRLVEPGGYLYLDSRNWDRELRRRERFHLYNPFFREDGVRINCLQVWDFNPDGTIDLNILNAYERDGRIYEQMVFPEHYHPVPVKLYLDTLAEMGYGEPVIRPLPCQVGNMDFDDIYWYCLMAQKLK